VGNGVEVELAVARGDTYLHKARFRPSAILTVGSNPMTTVTLDGSDIPDFLEFLNVTPEGAVLRFVEDTSVEVLSGSQVLTTKALMDGGYAKRTGEAFSVNLEVGGKAVVRMGDFKLMLKVEPTSGSEVFTVKAQEMDAAPCGKCGTNLRLILSGGGALTPCNACGALNQVSLAGTRQQQFEEQATRIAMPTGILGNDPAAGAPEQIDPHSSTGRAVGDLPTFDAISVLKDADAPAGAAEAIQNLNLAGGDKNAGVTNLASGGEVDPGSSTGRAASDLPTFDAIAVLKDDDAPGQPRAETVNLAGGNVPPPAPAPAAPPQAPAAPPQAPAAPPQAPAAQPQAPAAPPQAPAAPPQAPAPVAPAPAAAASAPQEAPVSTPPQQPEPTPAAPEPAAVPDDEDSPFTGQWEETLTIQAVKPKSKSIWPWIILMVLAFLGLLSLVAAVVVFKFVL
jgi:hypothetical protein